MDYMEMQPGEGYRITKVGEFGRWEGRLHEFAGVFKGTSGPVPEVGVVVLFATPDGAGLYRLPVERIESIEATRERFDWREIGRTVTRPSGRAHDEDALEDAREVLEEHGLVRSSAPAAIVRQVDR